MRVPRCLIRTGVWLGLLTIGCSRADAPTPPAASGPILEGRPWAILPQRAEVVARADQWAVQGASMKTAEGAQWLERAGRLRERIWRLEGREPDGLEALELLKDAGDRDWSGACRVKLRRALLDGEIRQEPDRVY